MDWLKQIAPTIATAMGGPLALETAVQAVVDVLSGFDRFRAPGLLCLLKILLGTKSCF